MLITKDSTESYAKRQFGGKGYNLYILTNAGLDVPEWSGIPARLFEEFCQDGVGEKIVEILSTVEESSNLEEISQKITQIIVDAPYSDAITVQIKEAYKKVGKGMVSIRSSAVDEDSASHSFAGQLSSFLYVEGEADVLKYVKECWASAYTARGLYYRIKNNIPFKSGVDVAVVVQRMLDCSKSGVLFTCDPIANKPETMIINSVYGVGEGLVSGRLAADSFEVDASTGKVTEKEIVEKTAKLVREASGTLKEVALEENQKNIASLDESELETLTKLGGKVEDIYSRPQDIEWGKKDGKFYLLQSRPVTTVKQNQRGLLYVWDNSNIVESYGGITLPLTFTFARYVYYHVYLQLCRILLVPNEEIEELEPFLKNMLGSFYGRVYYNLINWYRLITIIPGFSFNRSFMETMMGVDEALSDEIAERVVSKKKKSLFRKITTFISGMKLIHVHFAAQRIVDDFLTYFHKVYDQYLDIDFSRMNSDKIMKLHAEVEEKLLGNWQAPILNDLLCMIHFGLFKKLTEKYFGEAGEEIRNDLLCGEGNLESAEPTRELIRMAGDAHTDEDLKHLILNTPVEDCLEALNQSIHSEFKKRVDNYIRKYGFRCMSEMKMEQPDLHQDPSFLFICLRNYLRAGQVDLEEYEKREKELRSTAEKKVKEKLGGLKRVIYGWSLKHTRRAVKNRENTRFCRTRVYGIIRSMYFAIGDDFVARGIIKDRADIFYITLDELKGSIDGHLTNQGLEETVELRKRQYEEYKDQEPAPRFITRGPVYWQNEHFPEEEVVDDSDLPENCLKGVGCCPGEIEGVVKVINDPSDDMDLNGEILVTTRTDPGWIPLYPSLSGLLVERGGLLSHSAIVAREMGLPTVVSIKGLVKTLKNGMKIKMNGKTGIIEILDGEQK